MAAQNYILLETIQLSQTTSSVVFDNLPTSGYTDLKIVSSSRIDAATPNIEISFNGSTTGFSNRVFYSNGTSSTTSTTYPRHIGYGAGSNDTTNVFGNSELYIPNYRSSNNKSFFSFGASENNATTAYIALESGLWSNTAAITSITLTPQSGNFVQHSSFSLYGISQYGTTPVTSPFATGGDRVSTDGTYWYHEFLSSGNFIPAKALTCDYLVIAGGGGGGSSYGGGGGAGGYRTSVGTSGGGASAESALSLSSGVSYSVLVGAGGYGTFNGYNAVSGNNSIFHTITSTAGGGGGGPAVNGASGGSGGGAGGSSSGSGGGGSGTANQGFAGGGRFGQAGVGPAGGGGGAGGAGTNASASQGGAGGAGVSSSITGISVTRAGGGGGGTISGTGGSAGSGGAGAGGAGNTAGGAGTASTGSGGGGSGEGASAKGGNGGSGIVIIRYAMA